MGSIHPIIDWVITAMLCLNKRNSLLKFSVSQEAEWENNNLGKIPTEWQLSLREHLDKNHKGIKSIFESQIISRGVSATLARIPAHWNHLRLQSRRKKGGIRALGRWQVLKRKKCQNTVVSCMNYSLHNPSASIQRLSQILANTRKSMARRQNTKQQK